MAIKKLEKAEAQAEAPVSREKTRRQAVVEKYKVQNPVKFAAKEKELKAWVESA